MPGFSHPSQEAKTLVQQFGPNVFLTKRVWDGIRPSDPFCFEIRHIGPDWVKLRETHIDPVTAQKPYYRDKKAFWITWEDFGTHSHAVR